MNEIFRPFRSTNSPATTVVALVAITVAVAVGLFFARTVLANNGRLVTIHVDETEYSIRTDVGTVAEALDKTGVKLNEADLVEPKAGAKIESDVFHVNVFRARAVTVVDGDQRQTVQSAHQSPQLVAEQAGFEVYDEDEFKYQRVNDFVNEGMVGVQLIIDRATPVSLDLFGNALDIRTQALTVGELLAEKEISYEDENVTLFPNPNTDIRKDLKIKLTRNGKQLITAEENIQFEQEVINDNSKEIGSTEIQKAGVLGTKLVTYELILENGEEVSRKEIESVVLKEPQTEVVIKGTKPAAPVASNISGTKEDWMRAAGIPESEWTYVDFIVGRESGWNPNAVNVSTGACGLGQQFPCGKWPGAWNDPVAALQGQYGYVLGRYGGYAQAYAFWSVNHWY